MSWSDRRAVLALGAALLALPGCFRPMLAEGGAADEMRGRIALPQITDRFSYYLNDSLESRLGRAASPDYRLEVDTSLTESGLLVAQDNTITRLRVRAVARYKLFAEGVEAPIIDDQVVSESGYDSTASLYASQVTRRDIERRLARDLGERMARRIQARAGELGAATS